MNKKLKTSHLVGQKKHDVGKRNMDVHRHQGSMLAWPNSCTTWRLKIPSIRQTGERVPQLLTGATKAGWLRVAGSNRISIGGSFPYSLLSTS